MLAEAVPDLELTICQKITFGDCLAAGSIEDNPFSIFDDGYSYYYEDDEVF